VNPTVLALFATPREGASGVTVFLVQMALIFAIFYYLLIRPHRKEQEKHEQVIATLKKGDEIVTSGGIIGTVIHAEEKRLTIKTGESTRIVVDRSRVAARLSGDQESAK
jgi:preprotein translocase subunit YajC